MTTDPNKPRIAIEELDRYLANESSEAERIAVNDQIRADADLASLVGDFQALGVHKFPLVKDNAVELALARVHREVGISAKESTIKTDVPNSWFRSKIGMMGSRSLRYATAAVTAVAAIVAALFLGWYSGSNRAADQIASHMTTYKTALGERATITLPDSSKVILNVGSTLIVPSSFATSERSVYLTGEALFNVNHNSGIPFIVNTGQNSTRVLGTVFSVRQFVTDTMLRVSVKQGKVEVNNTVVSSGQAVTITPMQKPRFQAAEDYHFTFAKGIMTLNDIMLNDAIPELNRWYNVEIQLGDPSLAYKGIGGSFASGSISDLISFLELVYNVDVVRAGRVITLFSR